MYTSYKVLFAFRKFYKAKRYLEWVGLDYQPFQENVNGNLSVLGIFKFAFESFK